MGKGVVFMKTIQPKEFEKNPTDKEVYVPSNQTKKAMELDCDTGK